MPSHPFEVASSSVILFLRISICSLHTSINNLDSFRQSIRTKVDIINCYEILIDSLNLITTQQDYNCYYYQRTKNTPIKKGTKKIKNLQYVDKILKHIKELPTISTNYASMLCDHSMEIHPFR